MSSQILLNVRPGQIRMACIENGSLKQVSHYQRENPSIVGSIYKGRVSRIQGSFNFAFVNIGLKKGGFLYGKDLAQNQKKVDETLKVGEDIIVQIKTDPVRDKGPRLTTEISLAGFYIVYVPNQIKKIVFSRRIADGEEKKRITEILESFDVQDTLIVRTLAEGKGEKELKKDLENVKAQWKKLQERFKSYKGQGELQERENPIISYLKNYLNKETKTILIDEEETYSTIKKWLKDNHSSELVKKVKKYSKISALYKEFNIESQIEKIQSKKVYLKNGGSLIFEELEAFVVIDVNTARYKGKKNISESILAMNLEAAITIAEQITLRELGGIILIDFIDMEDLRNRKKVVSCLEKELEKDKAQTKVFPMGDLGLVQITRKRKNLSLSQYLKQECSHCNGEGRHKKTATIAAEILIKLENFASPSLKIPLLSRTKKLKVTCHPKLKHWIEEKDLKTLKFLKEKLYIEPFFVEDSESSYDSFRVEKA